MEDSFDMARSASVVTISEKTAEILRYQRINMRRKKQLKIIKTIVVYMTLFCMGLSVSITGPCLLDLQQVIGADSEHIALIYTCRSVGYLIGAIGGGILLDVVPSKFLVLTVCNLFVTVTMFAIPWSRNVITLLSLATVNGIALSAINTGANVVCVELWHRGPYLQALHFTFGVGGLVSPLIAAPFLEYQNDVNTTHNTPSNFSNNKDVYSLLTTEAIHHGTPKVTYPFSIIGGVCLLATVLLLLTFLASPRDERELSSDKGGNSHRGCVFMFFMVIFTFLVFFIVTGAEYGFTQGLTTYAVKGPLHLTTVIGSYMTSAYWAAFTAMRFISVFLSIKYSDMTLIVTDLLMIALAGILLVFFMPNEWALWAACITCGAGLASTFPSLVGWIDNYIVITSKITSIFSLGCAAGEMVVPFIIAYYMDSMPDMFAYVTATSSISTAILLLVLVAIFKHGNKTMKDFECYEPPVTDEKPSKIIFQRSSIVNAL